LIGNPGTVALDALPLAVDVFPGDACECASTVGASAPVRAEAARHGWRVLAILSALMGFASISTDLYLPAMPAMSASLGANTGMIELTVSGYLIGFSFGQLLRLRICPPTIGPKSGAIAITVISVDIICAARSPA
jgi:MFS transporter, DHA1 family, multidrug resistance protein